MPNKRRKEIFFGLDEVGRGALSGPVVACAIIVEGKSISNQLRGIRDSKKMSPEKREKVYYFLKKSSQAQWGIGRVSEKIIDKINILQATKLAMEKAVMSLEKKIKKKADCLLIDGNFNINSTIRQRAIIKGDEKIFLIKISSIVAKVVRDKIMVGYHKKYFQYGFDKNKGYGTELHLKMLKKYGPCSIHRKTFSPVKHLL